MKLFRSLFGLVLASSLILFETPAYAFDGASFGAGMGLGLLSGAMASRAGRYQTRYGYRSYRAYAPRRHRIVRAAKNVSGSPADNIDVSTGVPWELHNFHDCGSSKMPSVTARAAHGYVREKSTTLYVCGEPQHPATIFVYVSPTGYVGPDKVDYFERGRLIATDNLTVGSYGNQVPDPEYAARTAEESSLLTVTTCKPALLTAAARHGFVNAVDGKAGQSSCDGKGYTKSIVYRSEDRFEGIDTVMVYSEGHSPVQLNVHVSAPVAKEKPRQEKPSGPADRKVDDPATIAK